MAVTDVILSWQHLLLPSLVTLPHLSMRCLLTILRPDYLPAGRILFHYNVHNIRIYASSLYLSYTRTESYVCYWLQVIGGQELYYLILHKIYLTLLTIIPHSDNAK